MKKIKHILCNCANFADVALNFLDNYNLLSLCLQSGLDYIAEAPGHI